MKKLPRLVYSIGFFLCLNVASLLRAQVIYDNIGNSDPFPRQVGYAIGGGSQQEVAIRFTAGSSLFLDYADLELWHSLGGTPSVNVALLANGASNLPGTLLEMVSVPLLPNTPLLPLTRAEFSNTTFLTAGSIYWLAVSPADATSNTAWEHGGAFPSGIVAFDSGQIGVTDPWAFSSSNKESGMRVFGVTPVPEASTFGMMGSALLVGLIIFKRRVARRG